MSKEPDAKNSPNGWNPTDVQLDLWPLTVRTTKNQQWQETVEKPATYTSISFQFNLLIVTFKLCILLTDSESQLDQIETWSSESSWASPFSKCVCIRLKGLLISLSKY